MTKPRGVEREFYDEMKARAERAEAELAQYRALYGKLVDQVVEIKRHELNMHPATFKPEDMDPLTKLGSKTQQAVEEFAYGDPELLQYNRNFALSEYAKRKATGTPEDEIDIAVARRLAEGDGA
jgi:hypothetical protein